MMILVENPSQNPVYILEQISKCSKELRIEIQMASDLVLKYT